ncbi:unnamed protein product [Eretmochelys imbricata]
MLGDIIILARLELAVTQQLPGGRRGKRLQVHGPLQGPGHMHKDSGRCPQGLLRQLGLVRAVPELSECPVAAALPRAGWGLVWGMGRCPKPIGRWALGAGGLRWGLGPL